MKRLNLSEFFQPENAYFTSRDGTTGLGATIIITPLQTIAVYNEKAPDINGHDLDGLGHHAYTELEIIANIFNVDPTDKLPTEILPSFDSNYIALCLFNLPPTPTMTTPTFVLSGNIPAFINEKQYAELVRIYKEAKALNVECQIHIESFDPRRGVDDFSLAIGGFCEDNGLEQALKFLQENDRIKDYQIVKNAQGPEHTFNLYDDILNKDTTRNYKK